jgi:hypothetical protein
MFFFIPFESSDIASLDATSSFLKIKSISCRISIIRTLALVVFSVSESRLRERPQLILLTRRSSYLLLFLSRT